MILHKNRRFWFGALISSALFLSLITYRIFFYSNVLKDNKNNKISWNYKSVKSGEAWMNIFQNQKKIGYTYRILKTSGEGYKIHEETVMKINTMGMTQDIYVISDSTTDMDFAVKNFDFHIASGSFNFSVKGEIKDSTLYIQTSDQIEKIKNKSEKLKYGSENIKDKSGQPGSMTEPSSMTELGKNLKPIEMPLENRPYLTSGIMQAVLASGLKKGEEMVLFIFDPSTLGQAPAKIEVLEKEDIGVSGKRVTAQKISLSFKGAKQFAWIDDKGEVVKEQGLLGITLVKTDRKGAVDKIGVEESDDLTSLVAVIPNKPIKNPQSLTNLNVKISIIDDKVSNRTINDTISVQSNKKNQFYNADNETASGSDFTIKADNERQKWKDGILTVEKESLEGLSEKLKPDDLAEIDNKFKQPDAFIQSNDYRIRSFAYKAVSPSDPPLEKVKKLVAWIQKNIKRQPVISLPNALSTLENRKGDCNEHAALLAAFCRALGIPAKIEAGVVYLNGRFYYHAWNSVFIGKWISVDSLFNQIPADVTHIALSSGGEEMQLDIVGFIGRIKIEILD